MFCFVLVFGQIVDKDSGVIDPAREMLNPVSVNEVGCSQLTHKWTGESHCGECEMQCFNKISCTY